MLIYSIIYIGDKMKKVTILSLHLNTGGVEKCITDLANYLCNYYEVEIISVYKLKNKPAFDIDDRVNIKYLTTSVKPNRLEFNRALKSKNIINIIKEGYKASRCLYLKKHRTIKAIKKCDSDFIISTRDIFNDWLGKYGKSKCVKIGWEHNHHHKDIDYIDKLVESCKGLDKLVLVSKSLKEFYEDRFQEKEINCRCIFIPNTIDYIPTEINNLDNNNIVSVGRLSKEKGFIDLIEVFKKAHDKNPNLHLDIVGDGPQRSKIEAKIKEYNLSKSIKLHGFLDSEDVHKILSKSSLYVMTSLTESFGIVLIEAMSHGLPCIAFDSAEGACDLIKDKELLINDRDIDKMALKINELLNDSDKMKKIGNKNREFSLNYDTEKVMKLWRKILKN